MLTNPDLSILYYSHLVMHIWPYKSAEDRVSVRAEAAQDEEWAQCGKWCIC